jgi:hypothetical protein
MRNLILLLALVWLSTCRGQEGFGKVDAWMEDNVRAMGGHALLMTVNLNNRGRQDREMELVRLVDAAL